MGLGDAEARHNKESPVAELVGIVKAAYCTQGRTQVGEFEVEDLGRDCDYAGPINCCTQPCRVVRASRDHKKEDNAIVDIKRRFFQERIIT